MSGEAVSSPAGDHADRPAGAERRLVVAICSYRIECLDERWKHVLTQLDDEQLCVIMDRGESPEVNALAEEIRSCGGTVRVQGATYGLSTARNTVLDMWPDHFVLFIDDDVLIGRESVASIGAAFAGGAQVVGARLVPPCDISELPWYLTRGQMHLLGWHSSADTVKIWGACMGVDSGFAHAHGLRFDQRLGRTGRRLESGDDTTFIGAMKHLGARETVLNSVHVTHDVSPARHRFRYLFRREYWQGRSEVRRGQPLTGLRKEWLRHWRYSPAGLRFVLATTFLTAFVVGEVTELVSSALRRDRRDRPRST